MGAKKAPSSICMFPMFITLREFKKIFWRACQAHLLPNQMNQQSDAIEKEMMGMFGMTDLLSVKA